MFLLGAFAIFLISLGLDAFPTSIIAKSSVVSSGGGIKSLLGHLYQSLSSSLGILLIVAMLPLLYLALNKELKTELRLLAFIISISAFLHLLVGRYGWYNRYEIYMWSSLILTLLYLNKNWFYQLPKKIGLYKMVGLMLLSSGMLCMPYYMTLMTTPLTSNNIYEQQYQMHRFAIQYNNSVAVNNLGYVSYQNNNYVLDLWGLASIDALKSRKNDNTANWMTNIMQDKGVTFTMIYDDWFNDIPKDWKKLGVLSLGKSKITPAVSSVSFYSIGCKPYNDIFHLIDAFSTTLPKGVVFEIASDNCINKDKSNQQLPLKNTESLY